jgi:hypothetical protein
VTALFFDEHGLLPVGNHLLTLDQLAESILVKGVPGVTDPWDESWRRQLVENLGVLVSDLWQVGLTEIYVDGSFVEDKAHPNDIDAYFECDRNYYILGQLKADLDRVNPSGIWLWEQRLLTPGSSKPQLLMWHRYRVEIFPHYGQSFGMTDKLGFELTFPSAFRQTRSGRRKGIIKLVQ